MPGYIVTEATPIDEEALKQYLRVAHGTITQYGGRHVVRGGLVVDAIEGDRDDVKRIIVLEFPSTERALEWYNSPEYAEARKVQPSAMTRRMFLVEGAEQAGGPPA
jgi:uncharacterized protein (DUF1330 family)